jgi:hypothetical protein
MHTPGPWVRRNIASKDMYVGPANDGGSPNVAIIPKRITRSDDEQMANALLIAAAPELLEALRAIAEGCSFPADDVQRAVRDRARTAIAKATGG